jgi:hypothetical protein
LGKRPDLTPAHQVLFETGIIAGIGGCAFASPIMWGNRTKPVSGRVLFIKLFSISGFSCCGKGQIMPPIPMALLNSLILFFHAMTYARTVLDGTVEKFSFFFIFFIFRRTFLGCIHYQWMGQTGN